MTRIRKDELESLTDTIKLNQVKETYMLSQLLETAKEFYADPENVRAFEKWKAKRDKQN